jgi:hypothetical protein
MTMHVLLMHSGPMLVAQPVHTPQAEHVVRRSTRQKDIFEMEKQAEALPMGTTNTGGGGHPGRGSYKYRNLSDLLYPSF